MQTAMGNHERTDRSASRVHPITIIMQPILQLVNKKSDTVSQKKSKTVYQCNINVSIT